MEAHSSRALPLCTPMSGSALVTVWCTPGSTRRTFATRKQKAGPLKKQLRIADTRFWTYLGAVAAG